MRALQGACAQRPGVVRGERAALREGPVAATASTIGPRIPSANAESLEIANVPGHDLKSMELSGGGNHGVLDQCIGLAMHEPRPDTERGGVHRQDVPRRGDLVGPRFDVCRLRGILLARDLDARLDLPERNSGQMYIAV